MRSGAWSCLGVAVALAACYPNPDRVRRQQNSGPILETPDGAAGQGQGGSSGGQGGSAGSASGGSPGSADAAPDTLGPPAAARACPAYAAAYCDRYEACSTSLLVLDYGTKERCRQRLQLQCDHYNVAGVTWPTQACADAYVSYPCDRLLREVDPAPCRTPGTVADGAQCAILYQCQSRRCVRYASAKCPVCVPRAMLGEPCGSDIGCADELMCNGKVCVTPRALNAPCDADNPCAKLTLTCRAGACIAPGQAGASCDTAADCDLAAGFTCNTGVKQCVHYVPGDSCRVDNNGNFGTCQARGTCNPLTFSCAPFAPEGSSCSEPEGPHCLPPAFCAPDKVCRLLSTDACL